MRLTRIDIEHRVRRELEAREIEGAEDIAWAAAWLEALRNERRVMM